eukprot:2853301-Pyramimonas_sp.AAC.1
MPRDGPSGLARPCSTQDWLTARHRITEKSCRAPSFVAGLARLERSRGCVSNVFRSRMVASPRTTCRCWSRG